MYSRIPVCVSFLSLILIMPLAQAAHQPDSQTIVQAALNLANQNCDQLSRNQACYGHDLLVASSRPGVNPFTFMAEGDIEDLSKIQSLRLSGLDLDTGTWGVALMQLRANLPASQPKNVTLVAFGDVELQNAVRPNTHAEVQVSAQQSIHVRQRPALTAGVISTLAPRQTVTAVERLIDSSWLRVMLLESGQTGWVASSLVSSSVDLSSLNPTFNDSFYVQEPMQAFYFSSAVNDQTTFSGIPVNGLIIQTPHGVGEVQFLINEINIQLGSTVLIQAQAGDQMTVSTLEGHADIWAMGIKQTAYAGTLVNIPLTENLVASGSPSSPQPYDKRQMDSLPISTLPRLITIAEPMTLPEIQERQEAQHSGNNGETDNVGAVNNNDPSDEGVAQICCASDSGDEPVVTTDSVEDNCSGQSCNAPGHDGICPGNSCNAPGHNKDEKQKKDK